MRTSLYSVLCIAIRIGAVVLAVETLVSLVSIASTFTSTQFGEHYAGAEIGLYVAFLALAAALWVYPGLLARLATGKASREVFESPLSASDLLRIALCVVGVFFAMKGIISLLTTGTRLVMTKHFSNYVVDYVRPQDIAYLVAATSEIVLGVALALGVHGLVGWIERLREHGLPAAFPAEDKAGS